MLTTKPLGAALCGAAVLLVTACGGGHGYSPEELNEMIVDTVRASARDSADGPGGPETLFDPTTYMCTPAVDARTTDAWRTTAPRSPVDLGDSVELGVLAPESAEASSVTASVIGPGRGSAAAVADTEPGEWSSVRYPDDFEASAESGVHTVIWSDTESGTPLTCDGFEVD
ncbi:hypothetical protein ACFWTE_29500 [Nocardiopsis sp. NPDC058631]|uniref:hypothetical protein n=1 Tax=Nocardiopsis sp. NPDC058631 TaxID=3346566 RepID=UPI0036670008